MEQAKTVTHRKKIEVLRAGRRMYVPAGAWISLPIGVRIATLEIETPDGARVRYARDEDCDSSQKRIEA